MNKETSLEKIVELLEKSDLPEEIAQLIKSSKLSRRARIVVRHILEHGFITTEDLDKTYGYGHPPRAARDVRDAGIPLVTSPAESSDGRKIAEYRLGDLTQIQGDKLGGRKIFSKEFKDKLREITGDRCVICSGHFESRYLQIDHRIPYEISGEKKASRRDVKDYMLVCGSCNRAKSWSCEHCPNWSAERAPKICSKCYWANPEDYAHIALREVRRVDILWDEHEIRTYEKLREEAQESKHTIPNYVKKIIAELLEG
jgi:hypothetical protein